MTSTLPRPPWLAQLLIRFTAPADDRRAILGDVDEEFAVRARTLSVSAARAWYVRQAVASAIPNLTLRIRKRRRRLARRRGDTIMQTVLQDSPGAPGERVGPGGCVEESRVVCIGCASG